MIEVATQSTDKPAAFNDHCIARENGCSLPGAGLPSSVHGRWLLFTSPSLVRCTTQLGVYAAPLRTKLHAPRTTRAFPPIGSPLAHYPARACNGFESPTHEFQIPRCPALGAAVAPGGAVHVIHPIDPSHGVQHVAEVLRITHLEGELGEGHPVAGDGDTGR